MFGLGGGGKPLPLGVIGSSLRLATGVAPATAALARTAPASVATTMASIATCLLQIWAGCKKEKGIKTGRARKVSWQWQTREEEEEESKGKAAEWVKRPLVGSSLPHYSHTTS